MGKDRENKVSEIELGLITVLLLIIIFGKNLDFTNHKQNNNNNNKDNNSNSNSNDNYFSW